MNNDTHFFDDAFLHEKKRKKEKNGQQSENAQGEAGIRRVPAS